MDKSGISRVVTVAGGRFAPGHVGELTQQVPFEKAASTQTTARKRRMTSRRSAAESRPA